MIGLPLLEQKAINLIQLVPNIINITYGRKVGYKLEEEVFEEKITKISATKIREKMRDDGKL